MRSKLNMTLDALYAGMPVEIEYGKPVDKLIINRKTLTAYPLSEEEIEFAESGVVHNDIECEVCDII